jgi:ornithine decarboxylase
VNLVAAECSKLFRGVDSEVIRELLTERRLETPQLLFSAAEAGRNYKALRRALPRAHIHYAVKSNNHQTILREVRRLGGNFDVCSAGEIDQVLSLDVDPSSLIHSHPIKEIREFDEAVAKGVEMFVVDNAEEVRKFARYPERRLKVLIRYRINAGSTAVVNLQYKFGCTMDEVLPLARLIEKSGHEFYGLCFHIGSQCIYPENYLRAIGAANELIHSLAVAGFCTRLLDIGGGFPVEYLQPIPDVDQFCRPIEQELNSLIPRNINVVCEPGRFISASPVTLVCSVIGKAYRDGKMWYYLDDGLYSTFSGILYDQCRYPVVTTRQGEEQLSVLAGPTCDSFDVMYDGLMIPEHEVGDTLVFPLTGAYCAVSGSGFNSLRRPEYKVIG